MRKLMLAAAIAVAPCVAHAEHFYGYAPCWYPSKTTICVKLNKGTVTAGTLSGNGYYLTWGNYDPVMCQEFLAWDRAADLAGDCY